MEIEAEKIRIKFAKWMPKWWQFLIIMIALIMALKGDYKELFDWIKSYL